ncbi:MAG: hypothetical protein JSW50_07440, partial [Candidatus Latescibacterota bacterium]
MKSLLSAGVVVVVALFLIGGTPVASNAQCPCILVCPAGDGGPTGGGPFGGTKTPDLNSDTMVNLVDLAIFAATFGPPGSYLFCADYNCDGIINLVDLALFAAHWLHAGPDPGYNAPGIDHYKIYDAVGPSVEGPITVRDQFTNILVSDLQLVQFG